MSDDSILTTIRARLRRGYSEGRTQRVSLEMAKQDVGELLKIVERYEAIFTGFCAAVAKGGGVSFFKRTPSGTTGEPAK